MIKANFETKGFHMVAFLLCVIVQAGMAQNPEHCATDRMHRYHLMQHPFIQKQLDQANQEIQAYRNNPSNHNKQRMLVTIPVVVHVVHTGEPVGTGLNISDAQVRSQIDVLNEDYRRLNADTGNTPGAFESVAADFEIEFCLAVRDPNGDPTNGIDRFQGNQASWSPVQIDNTLKPTTTWDRDDYLNIWTLRLGGVSASVLGYAIKPGNTADIDGVVVGYQYFGRVGNLLAPFNQGRTATHEVGHWLGLDHLWGLNDPNVSSCNQDDGIADTPNQEFGNYGCKSFPNISCAGQANGDMFMNYMDYVDDGCMNMFTEDQKTLVWSTLNTVRSSIMNSNACTIFNLDASIEEVIHPSDSICDGTFTPVVKLVNLGSDRLNSVIINYVVDGSFNQVTWSGSLGTGGFEYVVLPELNLAQGPHTIDLSTSAPNNGTDQVPNNDSRNISFVVLPQVATGSPVPFSEGFDVASFPPVDWTIMNADGDVTWERVNGISGFNNSTGSAFFDNHTAGPGGTMDAIISPSISMVNDFYPWLTFSYAYAQRDALTFDSLIVSYSLDCGRSWSPLWIKSGLTLATAAPDTSLFVPSAVDWQKADVLAPQLVGFSNIQFRFENHSNGGNAIYLDDINIGSVDVGIDESTFATDINVFPNPSSGIYNLQGSLNNASQVKIIVVNTLGQEVYLKDLGRTSRIEETISLSTFKPGLYILVMQIGENQTYRKLIKQ